MAASVYSSTSRLCMRMPSPAMKTTMSSLSEIRLSGCIPLLIVSETRVHRTAINRAAEPQEDWVTSAVSLAGSISGRGLFGARRTDGDGNGAKLCVVYSKESQMIFSKDYVGYLARQTV